MSSVNINITPTKTEFRAPISQVSVQLVSPQNCERSNSLSDSVQVFGESGHSAPLHFPPVVTWSSEPLLMRRRLRMSALSSYHLTPDCTFCVLGTTDTRTSVLLGFHKQEMDCRSTLLTFLRHWRCYRCKCKVVPLGERGVGFVRTPPLLQLQL